MLRLATSLVCILIATSLWGDCAPDHRSDKTAGVFIDDLIISGTSSFASADLQSIRSKLIGACVDEKTDDLEVLLKEVFQNEGYYAVVVKNLNFETIDPLTRPKRISVEADINEGQVYKLAQVDFVGQRTFSAKELRNALSLRKGQIFKRKAIATGFGSIRELYSKKGFGDFFLIVDDTANAGSSTVKLTLTVVEGPQYRMGKLMVLSNQKELAERLQTVWRIPAGAVFDFGYPQEYVKANRTLLPSSFTSDDLRIVRNCPEPSVEVWLILDEAALVSQSPPRDIKCAESDDKTQ
jgi:hypothetical protein